MRFFRRRLPPVSPDMAASPRTATERGQLAGRVWLDVPYAEQDQAKALGARWDLTARSWFARKAGPPGLERWERLPDLLPGEDRTFGSGLFVEMIPSTSWFRNVRAAVEPRDWDRLRRMVYDRAGNLCEACGRARDREAGVQMEAHERFSYDEPTRIQTLRRLVCLCSLCHLVTHFGRANQTGRAEEAFAHLMAVTGMSRAEAERHVLAAGDLWEARSEYRWDVDLSMLSRAGIAIVRPSTNVSIRSY